MGIGECAGELVPAVEFALSAAEQKLWSAQDDLERGTAARAADGAYRAMLMAAAGLVRHLGGQTRDDPDEIIATFRAQVLNPGHFDDPFAKSKFGRYLVSAHTSRNYEGADVEMAHQILDQARLFLEASYACTERLLSGTTAPSKRAANASAVHSGAR